MVQSVDLFEVMHTCCCAWSMTTSGGCSATCSTKCRCWSLRQHRQGCELAQDLTCENRRREAGTGMKLHAWHLLLCTCVRAQPLMLVLPTSSRTAARRQIGDRCAPDELAGEVQEGLLVVVVGLGADLVVLQVLLAMERHLRPDITRLFMV